MDGVADLLLDPATGAAGVGSSDVGPAADLARLAAEYWDTYLETHPLFATAVGDSRFDDRLSDPTPAGAAAARARFADLGGRLAALPPERLTGEDAITLSALRESITSDIAELDTGLPDWNIDPLEGVPADLLLVPDYQRLESPADRAQHGGSLARDGRVSRTATWRRCATACARTAVCLPGPGYRTVAILEELLDGPSDAWPLLAPLRGPSTTWRAGRPPTASASARTSVPLVEQEIRPAFETPPRRPGHGDPARRPVAGAHPWMCHVEGGARGVSTPDPRPHLPATWSPRPCTGSA